VVACPYLVSQWPFSRATITGVSPFLLAVMASAPQSFTSANTVAVCPFPAVMKTGVVSSFM